MAEGRKILNQLSNKIRLFAAVGLCLYSFQGVSATLPCPTILAEAGQSGYVSTLIDKYFERALKSNRRLGVEIELKGPPKMTLVRELQRRLGGEIKGVVTYDSLSNLRTENTYQFANPFDAEALPLGKLVEMTSNGTTAYVFEHPHLLYGELRFEKKGFTSRKKANAYIEELINEAADGQVTPPVSLIQRLSSTTFVLPMHVDGKAKDAHFVWEQSFHLLTYAGRRLQGTSLNDVMRQINEIVSDPERQFGSPLRLENTKVGRIDIKDEVSVDPFYRLLPIEDYDALEVVCPPRPSAELHKTVTLYETLHAMGARGTEEDFALGVHFNVEESAANSGALARGIKEFDEHHEEILTTFDVHHERRRFNGRESPAILQSLHQNEEDLARDQVVALYHANDGSEINTGKSTAFNTRHTIAGRRPAIEFRFLNSFFGPHGSALFLRGAHFALAFMERMESP